MKIFLNRNLVPSGKYFEIYQQILLLSSSKDSHQLNQFLISASNSNFEEPSDLHEWITILNILDERLSAIITSNEPLYLPEKTTTSALSTELNEDPLLIKSLIAILQFTRTLLRSCWNKDIYNSTEFLLKLLRCYHDEVAILALEAVTALSTPPLIHRCTNFTPHTTAMHKSSANCIPLFQIVEAANWPFSVIAEEFLSENFSLHEKHTTLEFDISQRPKVYGSDVASEMTPGLIQSLFVIPNIHLDPRNVKTILSESGLPHKYLFALMWRIRLLRRITTIGGRIDILKQQYRSILILLCCHPNTSVLSHFFQDKTDLLRDFIFMIRSGPGSSDYVKYQAIIPLDLRLVACQCLIAIVGSRDSSSISVMGRFSWLQHDLGVNRGQYMGLLPCLLRSAVSFLSSLQHEDPPAQESSQEMSLKTLEIHDRLLWTESILTLTLALISVSNALTALTENGFISLLLSIVKINPWKSRSSLQVFVEVLVVQIMDMSLTGHPLALSMFEDLSGIDSILERLIKELTLLSILPSPCSAPAIETRPSKRQKKEENLMDIFNTSKSNLVIPGGVTPSAVKIYINSVLGIFSLYLHESHGHQAQFLRSPTFASLFSILFKNSQVLSISIMTSAITLFSEVINNDPIILSHMISNGLAESALLAMMENSKFFHGDCLLMSLNCISALSLTAQGKEMVLQMNPFPSLFCFFHNPLSLEKRVSLMEMSNSIGGTVEELLRHHPELAEPCVEALMKEFQLILAISDSFPGLTMEDSESSYPEAPNVKFTTMLQFAKSILNCFESILMKKENVILFLNHSGVAHLTQLLRVAHKPARYVVASFSCSTDPSTHSLGHYPVVKAVTKCFGQIADKEPKRLISELTTSIQPSLDSLSGKIDLFWTKNGGKPNILSASENLDACQRVSIDGDIYHISQAFFLHRFLDCVPRIPLQNNCSNGTLSEELLVYAAVLQEFMVLDYLVEGLSLAISVIHNRPTARSSLQELVSPENLTLIKRLVEGLYVGSQQELCRARGVLAETKKSERVKLHPVYRLLVIANDFVVVRDSADDTGKKMYKLEKGVVVNAYERATGNDNLIKYHIDDGTPTGGWVSYFRSHESLEPQIEVIDTIRSECDEERRAAEFLAKRKSVSTQKRFDFDKVANVSPRRGGFMILFHFHYCMRHFLKSIAWTFTDFSKENNSTPELLPLINNCLSRLLPIIPEQLCVDPTPPSRDIATSCDVPNKFLVLSQTPDIGQFSIEKTFRTIHVVELCHYFLFEEKKGARGDPNLLLMTFLFHGKFIEKLSLATSLVFLTCIREPTLVNETQHSSSSASSVTDNISQILQYQSSMDKYSDENDDESDIGESMEVVDVDVDEGQSNQKSLRKKIKDRRMLAVSNVDLIIDLWKNFFRSYSVTSSGSLELMELSDATHSFDPIVIKRKLLMTLVRYVGQSWSHEYLHTLPPTTVKNVFDLVQVVIKSMFEAKNDPLTSQKSSKQRPRHRLQRVVDSDSDQNDDILDLIRRAINGQLPSSDEAQESESHDDVASDHAEDVIQEEDGELMPWSINDTLELSKLTYILPPMSRVTSSELQHDQTLVDLLHKYIYSTLPNSCYKLIERGIRSGGVQWRSEAAMLNQNITREFTTVMVLSQLLSCLERPHWSDATLRIVQMSALFPRTSAVLKSDLTIESCSSLYGLLHSILLFLSGKISASSKLAKRNEMIYLVFGHRGAFAEFYDQLLDKLENAMDLIIGSSESSFPDNPCLDWICPALLILDVMTQPILFDKDNVVETLREIRTHEDNTKSQEEPTTPIITQQIKIYLTQRFGLKPRDFGEISAQGSSSETSSLQCLPLETENGLTPELSLRTLDFSVRLLRSLKPNSKRASGVYQALMQLIVHLTRSPELRKHLLDIISIHEIIHLCAQFEGSSFFLFSLILHITEDPESLAKSMQSVMRFCIQRISKTEISSGLKRQDNVLPSAITLESFLGILTPLLYRNEEIFLSVFKAHLRVFEHGRVLMVGLKDPSQEIPNDHKTEGHVQVIVDEVLMLIMFQWIRISSLQQDEVSIGCNRRSGPPPSIDSFVSALNLPLSDLLILLADLITSVPGLATCIHKFQLPHALERFSPEMHDVLKFCLSDMKHVVTGEPLHSTSFLTFLIHYLLVSQYTVPITSPSTTNHGTDQIVSDLGGEESDQKRKEMLTSVIGKSMTDSPAYLVAALLARPGDGRRRTMKELLNALKIHEHAVDTTEKLKAISVLASTFQKYQTVNPAWRRSEMLVVPTKELLDMMSSQKAYQTFSEVLCAIRLDHPLAQQISLDLAIPLEILVRKGILDCPPVAEPVSTSVAHHRKRVTLTDAPSQNPPGEFPGSTSTDSSQPPPTPSAPPRSEQSHMNSDLPIEVSMSDYIPRSDDQEFADQSMYQSDEGEEEEEEEEEEVDDEDEDDEDDEDDEVDEDEDDDDQDDDPGVSFYANEEEAEMSSEDEEEEEEEESNQNENGEFVQVPVEEENVDEDHHENEEDGDDAHAGDVADHIFSMLANGAGDPHDDEDDDDDDDENQEDGTGDVEQEIFLNGDMENPELENELRRMVSSPGEDEDGDDDDPTGGLDSGYLVNLEDDDEGQIEVSRSPRTTRGQGTVQIHHNSGGVQVHIQGNEAMFDLLSQAHMPSTPMFNPRLQRSGSNRIPHDIRNFLTQMTSMSGIQVQSRFHGQPQDRGRPEAANAATSQPVLHPLLAVTDPRQAREIFSSNPPGRGQAMMDHILSAIDSHAPFGSRTLGGAQQRMEIAERRRLLNPFVCDRRWGTDIGELELVGGRIKPLVESFKNFLGDMIEKKNRSTDEDSKDDLDDHRRSRLWKEIAKLTQPRSPIPQFDLMFPELQNDPMEVASSQEPETLPVSSTSDPNRTVDTVDRSEESAQLQSEHPTRTALSVEDNDSLVSDEIPSHENNMTAEEDRPISTSDISPEIAPPVDVPAEVAPVVDVPTDSSPNVDALGTADPAPLTSGDTDATNSINPVPPSAENTEGNRIVCPAGIDRDVWESLPLEVQLELAGASEDASLNIPQDDIALLESTELDRDTLAELPPEMRTEVLRDEAVVRMRRQSFDESGNLRTAETSSTTESDPQVNYGETFLASLPPELREDALLSADEAFLSTLPPNIQAEARELRRSRSQQINLAPGLLFWGNDGNVREDNFARIHQAIEVPHRQRRAAMPSLSPPARRAVPKNSIDTAVVALSDNTSPVMRVPFTRSLPSRLLLQLYTTRRARLPKPLLKLMVAMSKYRVCRKPILETIVAMMFQDVSSLSLALNSVNDDSNEEKSSSDHHRARNRTSSSVHDNDVRCLIQVVSQEKTEHDPISPVVLRRLLNAIYYLCKKTEKLVWYDVMQQNKDSKWIFGQLLNLLIHPSMASNANIDMILHVIQELLEDLSKLSISTVNTLIARRNVPSILDNVENSEGSSSWDRDVSKRVRVSPPAETSSAAPTSSMEEETKEDTKIDAMEVVDSSQGNGAAPPPNKLGNVTKNPTRPPFSVETSGSSENIRCDLPFPVLDDHTARILAGLIHYENCGGAFPSRLSRILNTLSLYDENWTKLLECLRGVSEDVALSTINEARFVKSLLEEIVQQNGTAASAMSVPYLSTPSSVSELRLLHVLRLVTSLRQAKDDEAEEDVPASQSAVSAIIKRIDFQDLWDLLVGSLDLVRTLEGIIEPEISEGVAQAKEKENTPTLSALTMRFVPLIECYLTVCGSTLLKTIDEIQSAKTEPESSSLSSSSSSLKRVRSEESSDLSAAASVETSSGPSLKIQKNQMPGLRFRQTPEFKRMQQDLEDSLSARRLLRFVERNSVLLNMVLKQNVNLLETSFSPLIQIPKCRALLHFDIKRAFFKMKLKKMKRNTQRPYESSRLRLSVRRQNIFEDSFQKLRFCSAAEMRRPISVTFHGEDGIDAGGVAREWYSELAKEIFNANYCLFDNATNDNVTFQPNPYSHINSHHLDYFKFIGRIIGKAICDGQLLDAHFTRSFYKHILGVPINYHDLEATEPEFYKSLVAMLEHPLELLGLELTFTAELNEFGKLESVDLVEGGRNIAVTDENKLDYIRLVAHHRMTSAILKQIDAFLDGFHELVPPELVSIFDAQELELLISGLPDIDLDDLRAHTEYQGYKPTDPVISYFWAVLRGFSQEEKALFLQYVTGTSKVPLDGFQALRGNRGVQYFSIHKAFGTHLLPCAHTCFNQLDLPEYASEDDLREKLLLAMREGAVGFGIA